MTDFAGPDRIVTTLESIETGNPELNRSQEYASEFMQRIESLPDRIRNRIPAIYERSAISRRYSCVPDYGRDAGDFELFPPNWRLEPAPSTGARNAHYRRSIVPLAEDVARRAIRGAGIGAADITHVVTVSCTGFFAPGIDIELVKRLGMGPDTRRTHVGFMGCYAAFNALRVADGFCRSHPNARVLVVCAELCTLHFQIDDTLESAVVNALFADGAAAAVLAGRPASESRGRLTYVDSHALLDDDSMEHMTWEVGDTGFKMGLSSRVPSVLARQLPGYVDTLTSRNGVDPSELDFWAIHPGGRAIVDEAQKVLSLSDDQVADSLGVLADYGNMSSPTVLFVLKRVLDRHTKSLAAGRDGYRHGIAMAFGPGLTLEGCLFSA